MNNQNPIPNQVPAVPPPATQPTRPKISDLAKEVFRKLYENKKVFRLIIAIFALLFLVIVVGLVFSALKNKGQPKTLTSPTPEASFQPREQSKDETLTKLNALKEEVFNLDIHQKRLSPPSVNFKISF